MGQQFGWKLGHNEGDLDGNSESDGDSEKAVGDIVGPVSDKIVGG